MSRDVILRRIRASLGRAPLDAAQAAACDRRSAAAVPTGLPGIARFEDRAALEAAFRQRLAAGGAEVVDVVDWTAVPAMVARRLAGAGVAPRIGIAPALAGLNWAAAGVTVQPGPAQADQPAGLSRAVAGVAETGSLVLISGPDDPVTLNFLPDLHIVCLDAEALVASLDDGLAAARANGLPRSIHLIGGPSRTADIEQRMVMGAHGPRHLIALLVGHGA